MGRAWKPGEAWLREEGAPDGPEFTVTIASSRKGKGPYRLHRDPVTGTILHQPACEAWANGHKLCRHTTEAIRRSEQPDAEFALAVHELIVHQNLGFVPELYASPRLEAWHAELTRLHNEWMDARGRIGDHTMIGVTRAEWQAKTRDEQRAEVEEMFNSPYRVSP
jgi:hypothetical protein